MTGKTFRKRQFLARIYFSRISLVHCSTMNDRRILFTIFFWRKRHFVICVIWVNLTFVSTSCHCAKTKGDKSAFTSLSLATTHKVHKQPVASNQNYVIMNDTNGEERLSCRAVMNLQVKKPPTNTFHFWQHFVHLQLTSGIIWFSFFCCAMQNPLVSFAAQPKWVDARAKISTVITNHPTISLILVRLFHRNAYQERELTHLF